MSSAIIKDLPELVEHNVISAETATAIENYYAIRRQPGSQMVIFGIFGGILVGLGIILVFAHNWDNFSKGIKTLLALLPLVTFQLLAGYAVYKDKSRLWKESAGTLLFFSVGAAIAMVAQIYNLPGNESSFILTWALLCLPMVYLLKSTALVILHLMMSIYYVLITDYFEPGSAWMYLALMAGFMPYYFGQLHRGLNNYTASICNWLIPLSLAVALGGFITGAEAFGVVIYLSLLCLLYTIGLLPYFTGQHYRQNGYLILGRAGIAVVLLGASFKWFWEEVSRDHHPGYYHIALCAVFFAASVIVTLKAGKARLNLYHIAGFIFPFVYIMGMYVDYAPAILTNILVLMLGIATIREGISRVDFGILNFGLAIVSALIIARFFDTQISFAVRGLLFIAVGAGFFAANYFLSKKRNELNKNQS